MDTQPTSARIIIVEDNANDVALIVRQLNRDGIVTDICRVQNERELRTALAEPTPWDVLLCDHNLPGFSSDHAFEITRALQPQLPFIIVSDSLDDKQALNAMRKGVSDVITKSQLPRVVPAVRRELREAEFKRQLLNSREHLKTLAYVDEATELPNARHFADVLGDHCENTISPQGAIVLLEVHHFAKFERFLGTENAENLMAELAYQVKPLVDANATLFRTANDQLGILHPSIKSKSDLTRLLRSLAAQVPPAVDLNGIPLSIVWRIGATLCSSDIHDGDAYWSQARAALRRSERKQDGPEIYDPAWLDDHEGLMVIEESLKEALEKQQFFLDYQPQYCFQSGQMIGAEALLRWRHPTQGVVPPGEFIPLLEETGLIVPVGAWVLKQACEDAAQWHRQGAEQLSVAVNLSVPQFEQTNLPRAVSEALFFSQLPAHCLELEITESVAVNTKKQVLHTLNKLRDLGVSLAIDDFGTGYSSLSYLKDYAVDKLKIDQSFIKNLCNDSRDRAIVLAIIQMASGLGMKTVAEGVETREQAEYLAYHHCSLGQGFHLGRPMSPDALFCCWQQHHTAKQHQVI